MNRGKVAARPSARVPTRQRAAMPQDDFPLWIVPLVYALATVILFREFFFSGGPLLGQDTFALSYFARTFYTEFVQEAHRFPLWDPYLFGGLPFVEGMHGDIFYPLSLALFFLDARTMWGWKMVLHIFLAGVFTYVWLRGIGLGRAPAFFGGLVYMLGADLVSLVYPGGDGKLFVSALAPLMFFLTERAVTRRHVSDFAFFSLGLALVLFTSHMQLAFFTVWGVSLYFLFRLVQLWRAERNGALVARLLVAYALAGVMGVGAAAVQFLPPLGYLREWSHRAEKTVQAEGQTAYEYSTTWSLHPEEAVSLVIPEFVGDNAPTETRGGDTYWGRNLFKLNHEYAGLVPLVLIPVLLLRRRDARALFFMVLGALAVFYGLGANTPLFRLFYLIPGVDLFRAPSIIIFLYGMSVATLGALGLQRLLDWSISSGEEANAAHRALWITAAVFGGLALLASAGVVTNVWQAIFEVPPQRAPALTANLENIQRGFWLAFALAAAVAGVWELMRRGLLGLTGAVLLFALLAAVDLYRVDRPFISSTVLTAEARLAQDPTFMEADESIRFLQQARARGEVFRALDVGAYGNNNLAIHGVAQVAGHHGNEMGRYRALVGGDNAENIRRNLGLLDLVNGAYIVSPGRLEDAPASWEVAFTGSRSVVYRNLNALPRAWLVGRAEVAGDNEALTRLLMPGFDARSTALIAEQLAGGVEPQPDPSGTVQWTNYGVNESTLRVSSDRPALLVITDNFHPAWKATIDGQEASIVRANYSFRAVPIAPGDHTVAFRYESSVLERSAAASMIVLALLLAVGVGGSFRRSARAGAAA